ncbi:Peptidase M16C associated domain protein [Magnetococcus marinus MC-1]|uniref:Peptidase M16C associated domain protein n=1 Tax=Magnetococcus marinus (strain ATCC BAA-1437 / JCM 17883 / MC-1) TaxID=156889 RepID=A0LBT4_MAGMM|nr:insulinase family protein [Magnetococcus marinus]ABK45427.1 Peptidase M16C associated domain protein [Magnetococcus marinus MC-1]
MSESMFELVDRQEVAALNVTVESYLHQRTGARHLHMVSQDNQNAFLVAFLTVPKDSTGVAHILEHTVLSGSERYPVRDPFFTMIRRSLATFMNAFTSSDWTAYPFASLSKKDFNNLLEVYLDAAFFPNLHPLDFAQEGYRIEPENLDDANSPLCYKGVVFNEMKGAMASPVRALWDGLSQHVFPTITYHHNSGGDPVAIPDLSWEALKAFHATHYHPSNAVFMTYGDIPAVTHQAMFETRVLRRFERLDVRHLQVPDEQRLTAPITASDSYAADDEPDLSAKTHQVVGWLWPKSVDLESLLKAHLLSGVLLDNSASPLLKALETSDLGNAPSPVCGVDDSGREMVFACGLEGSEPEQAEAVEALILQVLQEVAEQGVEPEQVEAVLHQLELSRREVTGDGLPYGLKLMLTALPATLHGGDGVAALNMDGALNTLREQAADPNLIPQLVRAWLLDNPHRVRFTLTPDGEKNKRMEAAEKARLLAVGAQLSDTQKEQLREQAVALKARQESKDDPEVLPKVTLADVPKDLLIPTGERASQDMEWYTQPTNGLIYLQAFTPMPELEPELLDLMPLYGACVVEVGSGGRDYLQTQGLISRYTGGVGARGSISALASDVEQYDGRFSVSSKALLRNREKMVALLQETLSAPRFDELSRLRELVGQMRASAEMKISNGGTALAIASALKGMSPAAAMSERWGGMSSIGLLKKLDRALEEKGALEALAEQLCTIRDRIAATPVQFLGIGEASQKSALGEDLSKIWHPSQGLIPGKLEIAVERQPVKLAWVTSTQVNYCARGYAAVPYTHADAPALTVLGPLMRNGFLHTAIREKGGAYGAGAGFDADAAAFRFQSFRDPRLGKTLQDFDRCIDWLLADGHGDAPLEEAILNVIGGMDKPGSPSGEAKRAYHDLRRGRTPEVRRRFRKEILAVTWKDLKRVTETYLQPALAQTAVVTNRANLDVEQNLDLERRSL